VLGGALGSSLGGSLKLQPKYRKILVGCGAASGIAAAFNAPFAGAFFALEEVLGSFSIGAFSPVIISSVVGALTVRSVLGEHPAFHIPGAGDAHDFLSALLYPFLGLACGLASALYVRMYLGTPKLIQKLRARFHNPDWVTPVLGGALTGVLVALTGGLIGGNGHLAIPSEVFGVGGLAWYLLIGMAIAKMAATSLTLASGGSGGVFTPTLFIGAALGGGIGRLAASIVPGHIVLVHAWAIVGMAGLVAGATRAPLTAIFIVFEMTNDATYIVPLMIVAVIAFVTAKRFAPYGLYDGWLAGRGEYLWHGVDRAVMDHMRVRDALDRNVERVSPSAGLTELLSVASRAQHGVIPVVELDGTLVGVIGHHTLREAAVRRSDFGALVVAADLIDTGSDTRGSLAPEQSLRSALRLMNARALDALPVAVQAEGQPRFVGLLSRADVLNAYEKELSHSV
jgi:CIC family chloride channel protein